MLYLHRHHHRQYRPVSGYRYVTINGSSTDGNLPAGSEFGNSTYNASNGDLSAGKVTFPSSTVTFDSGNGTVTYQFSQTNTSMGLVGSDGMTFLTPASMSLKVTAAGYFGIPIDVGDDCVFAPILWDDLRGSVTTNGLVAPFFPFD